MWGAKGWGLVGAAEELAEKPELERFHITHTKLSKKTTPGTDSPLEPEVAAAVERMPTRRGYERLVDIVMKGLRALRGAAPAPVADGGAQGEDGAASVEDVATVLKEYLPGELVQSLEAKASVRDGKLIDALEEKAGARESKLIDALEEKAGAREGRLIDALEEKAGARESKLTDALEEKAGAREGKLLEAVSRMGHTTWRRVAISSGLGALVGCLILVPFIIAAVRPPAVIFIPPGGPDTSPTWYAPGDLLALSEWGETRPLDQQVPFRTLPGQKVAPCNEGLGEVAINGNCWFGSSDVKPPCGRLFRHGDKCYRPIAADPKRPVEPGPDR